MRLKINLATQPYEDARRFLALWAGILGALVLLAVVLSYAAITRWHQYRYMSSSINREKQVLADFDSKQQQDLAILNQPNNSDMRENSEFLNGLIRRKEISWTRIFSDLERIMPPHLRVLSVEPQLNQDQIQLNMQLGGDSRDRAAELVRRMERSTTFRYARVTAEKDAVPGTGQADSMRSQVTAEYIPGAEQPETPVAPNSSAGAKQ